MMNLKMSLVRSNEFHSFLYGLTVCSLIKIPTDGMLEAPEHGWDYTGLFMTVTLRYGLKHIVLVPILQFMLIWDTVAFRSR